MQNLVDAHDTALSESVEARSVLGVTDQARPSQLSMRDFCEEPSPWAPTAMQNDELVHDTPSRKFDVSEGLTLGDVDQRAPFQRSTSVLSTAAVT
jgi:hypothetical protein